MSLAFTQEGLLPPGDHPLTLGALRESVLVRGPSRSCPPSWDRDWRAKLVDNLGILVGQLWEIGLSEIFIGGSFAEAIDHPHDIDGYFVCDVPRFVSRRLERELNRLDPYQCWGWDRRRPDAMGRSQIPMWHQYSVELWAAPIGQMSGVTDRRGNLLPISEAFRQSRRFQRRGMVKVERGDR